jgi:rhamnulokinase
VNCIAIDLGAGSGRVIRGVFGDGRLRLGELHRFANGPRRMAGHLRWDIGRIFDGICRGLGKAARTGDRPSSIGVDGWGVDYVLLDGNLDLLEMPVAYRDARTAGMMERFEERMGKEELYSRTGIQFLRFNTLYQLMAQAEQAPDDLRKARHFLMVPDYVNFLLTGKLCTEFTNATTTQMLNIGTGDWDREILRAVPVDPDIFQTPVPPGTIIGELAPSIRKRTGLGRIPVIAPATHDTGSAVASVPAGGMDWAFISSGTWSLVGAETRSPVLSKRAMEGNFTNEGGAFGAYRFLKNIMGLWLVSGLGRSLPGRRSPAALEAMAKKAGPFGRFIDADDPRFFSPRSMKGAFDDHFRATGQKAPRSPGGYARCALEGLALSYRETLEDLRRTTGLKPGRVHIIGGGCQNRLLDRMTADATGLKVLAGPVEGTAIGNMLVQAIALGELRGLKEARELVRSSFNIEEYIPDDTGIWDEAHARYKLVKEVPDGANPQENGQYGQ